MYGWIDRCNVNHVFGTLVPRVLFQIMRPTPSLSTKPVVWRSAFRGSVACVANSGRCIKYPVYDRSLGCTSLGVNERDHLVASTMKPVTLYYYQKVIFNIPLYCKIEERSVIPLKKYDFISSFSSAARASLWLALSNWENASKNGYIAKACWDFDQQENFWHL